MVRLRLVELVELWTSLAEAKLETGRSLTLKLSGTLFDMPMSSEPAATYKSYSTLASGPPGLDEMMNPIFPLELELVPIEKLPSMISPVSPSWNVSYVPPVYSAR